MKNIHIIKSTLYIYIINNLVLFIFKTLIIYLLYLLKYFIFKILSFIKNFF